MLESPFRAEFAAEFGDILFLNAEIDLKSFSPVIIEEMKEENKYFKFQKASMSILDNILKKMQERVLYLYGID